MDFGIWKNVVNLIKKSMDLSGGLTPKMIYFFIACACATPVRYTRAPIRTYMRSRAHTRLSQIYLQSKYIKYLLYFIYLFPLKGKYKYLILINLIN